METAEKEAQERGREQPGKHNPGTAADVDPAILRRIFKVAAIYAVAIFVLFFGLGALVLVPKGMELRATLLGPLIMIVGLASILLGLLISFTFHQPE